MTILDKSATVGNLVRNTSKVEIANTVQTRQNIATGGNNVPVAKPVLASDETAGKKALDKAMKSVSGYVQNITRELNFTVDEELNRSLVTVKDQETGEVIRQIPSEEMLALARYLSESIEAGENEASKGILFQGDA
ncbi:MAG: flagellar protein FlaG [Gammaproteobacteria bacterium]